MSQCTQCTRLLILAETGLVFRGQYFFLARKNSFSLPLPCLLGLAVCGLLVSLWVSWFNYWGCVCFAAMFSML